MKYLEYILTFQGDNPQVIDLLRQYVNERQPTLGEARDLGRAASLLFGVQFTVQKHFVAQAQPPVVD